eukprot:TRINITY_DN3192_c0_g1_i3.p2 TRINITY_DN3192_c0_g1~~TRINITY_DN3192_c0_g1_i3.p2  ORF type:complete len:103 (-),score=19.71 TRINITY_DN3192_c0_g1_i3:108-416(-)
MGKGGNSHGNEKGWPVSHEPRSSQSTLPRLSNQVEREREKLSSSHFFFCFFRYQYRSGGYTRVRPFGYRKGDHAPMALIEFLRDDKEMKYEDYFVTTPKIQE